METRFLESFVAVADHGSLADAARRLGITPAAVAQRLRVLEEELGVTLVARSGRTVRPTASGNRILAKARYLIENAHELRMTAEGTPVGQLRLGSISTALTGLLPRALVRLAIASPGIETVLDPGSSPELYERLARGDLDAAVLVRPRFELAKTLAWHTLRSEPLIVLASRKLNGSDPHKLLREQPFIRMHNNWGPGLTDRYLDQHRIRTKDRYTIDSLEAIAVMVDRGLGVALVPDWAPPWPEGLKLQKIGLPGAPWREIGLAWQRSSARLPLIQAFLAAVTAQSGTPRRAKHRNSMV